MAEPALSLGQTIRLADARLATIRFIGETSFSTGSWVGIELGDDTGKNDGSVQGERYFDCAPGRGMFVRPSTVVVVADAPRPAAMSAAARGGVAAKRSSMTGPAGGATRGARPTSGTYGSVRSTADASLGKRMSLNAPSPSPGPRTRPVSGVGVPRMGSMSPAKSPTKGIASGATSSNASRSATPSGGMKPPAKVAAKPAAAGSSRLSMRPPALPASRTAAGAATVGRQVSVASTGSRPSISGVTRTSSIAGSRLSLSGAKPRPESLRMSSATSRASTEDNGVPQTRSIDRTASITARESSDEGVFSPESAGSPEPPRSAPLADVTNDMTSPGIRSGPASAGLSTTSRPTTHALQASSREIEDLKAKLRVMERKRMEDRDRLKAMDKVQADRDKFENVINKLQAKYAPQQQEIVELKRLLREAEEAFASVEEMAAEHDSVLELATLDREMAEETAEVLKVEVDALKQKTEELQLELEILRDENKEFSKDISADDRASAGWLQMERNNERLREALIRLRDITQQQEEELREEIKELHDDLNEYSTIKPELDATKEKLSQSNATVEDLRQQLDNALGAEDMIEELTEKNMGLSEEMDELKAIIDDLENLRDVNDELEINHVQNEKEMQAELDFRDGVITEQARRAGQQEQSLEDMEYTLSRFRELVTSLQGDLQDMRASHAVTEAESEKLSGRSRAMEDLTMKLQMSAEKAQARTIDLEMRRLEAQEAEQHLEIVKMFLPESYQSDRDSVLALLRFKRLAFKANLLHQFVQERVKGQTHPGHEDEIFSGCDALDKLTWVSAMCERFINCISHCTLEEFAKYEGALYELEPVERALNGWIASLKRDELKEAQCATELQRTIALMTHLGEVHIPQNLERYADDAHMRSLLMQSHLESAAASIATMQTMVHRIVPAEGEEEDLAQYFAKKLDAVVSQTRSAKVVAARTVKALEELRLRSLSLSPDTSEAFEKCDAATLELAALARDIGLDLYRVLHEEGRTEPYTYVDVQNSIDKTVAATGALPAGTNENDLFATYSSKLHAATSQITDLASLSADLTNTIEFDRPPNPWALRAQELKSLKTVPLDAEEELRHLREEFSEARRLLAQKDENLSTASLKIETLESRMRDANTKTSRIAELEARAMQARTNMEVLQEDIERQDRELKHLESERDKWKKVAGDARAYNEERGSEAGGVGKERAVATARQMESLTEEITSLQSAVRYFRADARHARLQEQANYDWLAEPLLAKHKKQPPREARRQLVVAEGRDALSEMLKLAMGAKVYQLQQPKEQREKRLGAWRKKEETAGWHVAKQQEDWAAWKAWESEVVRKTRLLELGERGTNNAKHGNNTAKKKERTQRNAAVARISMRLPRSGGQQDEDGGKEVVEGIDEGRNVGVVRARDWDALQGRVMMAM